jgi:hypothetical protein
VKENTMSLFQWFAKKPVPASRTDFASSEFGHVDATVPFHPKRKSRSTGSISASNPSKRKNDRLEKRELLYAVIRESMTRAGVLSSSYKFKVLSLDSLGSQYLIMMDLVRLQTAEMERLAEIETLIAQSAKSRHEILVTSLYWRVSDQVTTGLSRVPQMATVLSQAIPVGASPVSPTTGYEPLQSAEIAAFKLALATSPKPLASPGEIFYSGRRNPEPPVTFADTEIGEPPAALSGTQYGDLS